MSGFHDLIAHVEEKVFLSANWFAEQVTFFTELDEQAVANAHVNYRYEHDGEYLKETLSVRVLKTDVPAEPCNGWRVYRSGDTRAFLYRSAYEGRPAGGDNAHVQHSYRCIFQRRTQQTQGAGKKG